MTHIHIFRCVVACAAFGFVVKGAGSAVMPPSDEVVAQHAQELRDAEPSPKPIDESEAIRRARTVLGDVLVDGLAKPERATQSRAAGDPCPLIADGLAIWKIEWDNAMLRLPTASNSADVRRNVAVSLDVDTGLVLRVEIVDSQRASAATPLPSAESTRTQFEATGAEIWHGPAVHRTITLSDALRAVVRRGMGSITESARLVINPVDQSFGTFPVRRAVWSIDCRGTRPFRQPESVPLEAVNHLRHIIDANSGAWLMACSTPQPPPDPTSNEPATGKESPTNGEKSK